MTSSIRRLNHYDVASLLGEGGMGTVYRATDTRLGRDVALKVLPPELTTDAGRLARFQREARALAALNHPNIVTIYSVEECEGSHFLAMELVEGPTLDGVIPEEGLAFDAFLSIALPLADSVAAAHAAGLTHRDLKPQNVMIGRDGRLKVLDFGLARFQDTVAASAPQDLPTMLRTQEGLVVGTLPYLAPEQIDGSMADTRCDVYALGVLFYEMATGRLPFVRSSPMALMAAILRDDPEPVATLAPHLPPGLHAIIERCMAKAPTERFPHGAALYQALRQLRSRDVAGGEGVRVAPLPPDTARPRPTSTDSSLRLRRAERPLVGRELEFERLVERLDETTVDGGSLVLLAGEPGVGKTYLCEQLLQVATDRGMLTFSGHCSEEGTAPYGPFAEILEEIIRTLPDDELRDVLGDDAPEIVRLVPKLARRWQDLPEPVALEPDQQRRALFSAVADVLRRLASRRPLVLLLDDLHWADDATVGLLAHIAPQLEAQPLLCLGTYRDIEADLGPAFGKGLATLVRQPDALLLPVRCLAREAVASLLAACAKSEPPGALVTAVFDETEGNAFFVTELFRHLSEDGQLFDEGGHWKPNLTLDALDVPEGVRVVVGHRLSRLSAPCQALVTAAAILGRRFDLELAEALCDLDEDVFLEALEEAEGAGLVAPEADRRQSGYAFNHELIRHTLLTELSRLRMQRFHAKAARVMEEVYGADGLAEHAPAMAHHLYEAGPAGDDARTVHFLELASEQGIRTGALQTGLDHLTRALTLAPGDDAVTRARLFWKHGLARRNVGQLMEAIDDWETALSLADPALDPELVASICQDLAHGYAWTGRGMLGVAAARKGLDALGPDHEVHRCRLTGTMGWNFALACDFESAEPILQEALGMAEQLGDAALVGEVLLLKSWHFYLCMRRREQADACRRAAELLRRTQDPGRLGEALVNFQMASIQIGRPGDIAATEVEARTLAERLGRFDIRVHQLYSETLRDWLLEGDIKALEAGFQQVEEVSGAWRWVAEGSLAQMHLWQGDLEKATAVAQSALSHEPPGTTHTGFGWSMAFLCASLVGDRDAALAVLDVHRHELPEPGRLNTIGSWSALLRVVEGLAVLRESEQAAALHPSVMEAMATESLVAFDGSRLLETVAGMAAAAGEDWSAAEGHFRSAIAQADEIPFRSEQAEARYELASMLLDRGRAADRPEARSLLEAAVSRYAELGAPWHLERARAQLNRA